MTAAYESAPDTRLPDGGVAGGGGGGRKCREEDRRGEERRGEEVIVYAADGEEVERCWEKRATMAVEVVVVRLLLAESRKSPLEQAVPRITFRLLLSALGQHRVSGGRNKVSNAVSTVKYTTVVNFTANFLAGPASYAWPSLCGTGLVTYH